MTPGNLKLIHLIETSNGDIEVWEDKTRGLNRARYFLSLDQQITPTQATAFSLELGYNWRNDVLQRADTLAKQFESLSCRFGSASLRYEEFKARNDIKWTHFARLANKLEEAIQKKCNEFHIPLFDPKEDEEATRQKFTGDNFKLTLVPKS